MKMRKLTKDERNNIANKLMDVYRYMASLQKELFLEEDFDTKEFLKNLDFMNPPKASEKESHYTDIMQMVYDASSGIDDFFKKYTEEL